MAKREISSFTVKDIPMAILTVVSVVLLIGIAIYNADDIDKEYSFSQNDSYIPSTEKIDYTERDLLKQVTQVTSLACPQKTIELSKGAVDITSLTSNNPYGVSKFIVPNENIKIESNSFAGNNLSILNDTEEKIAKALSLTTFCVEDRCIKENSIDGSKSEKYTVTFTDILGRYETRNIGDDTGSDNPIVEYDNSLFYTVGNTLEDNYPYNFVPIIAPFDFEFVNNNVDDSTGNETIIIQNKAKTCKIIFNNCANWLCAGDKTSDPKWIYHRTTQHNTPIGADASQGLTGGLAGSVIGYAQKGYYSNNPDYPNSTETTLTVLVRSSNTANYHQITFYEFLFAGSPYYDVD